MQREIARFSLCILIALGVRAEAVPWREKGAIRFASSLPKRLIDSIMAQGNWNLLFQEGPFSEFQRQIAIANYFALRGELTEADVYFKKADTALTIAYASLRGKYEWPRLSQGLVAKDLPWGENRETFQDFVLCSLQLYIESGLKAHESGNIDFEALESAVANAERQLSAPLKQKDADMHAFLLLLQDALKLRQSRQLNALEKADRFDQRSSAESVSGKNYWNRRALYFRIFENIYHGNLGRARALADDLYERQREQLDPLVAARIFTATAGYDEAQNICEDSLKSADQKQAENQTNYIRHSVLLQNLHMLRRNYEKAERTAVRTAEHLQGLLEAGSTANEERLALRKSWRDQQLRGKMFAYLQNKTCPASTDYADAIEMEPEWRIKARLFYETCGLRHDRLWWQAIGSAPGAGMEIAAIAAFAEKRLTTKQAGDSPPLRLLLHRQILANAREQKQKAATLAGSVLKYLRLLPEFPHDFVFVDWGIAPTGPTEAELASLLPSKIDATQALMFFQSLHRNFAAQLLRGAPLNLFAPPDTAHLTQQNAALVLEQTRPQTPPLQPFRTQPVLHFRGESIELFYSKATGITTQNPPSGQSRMLFGSAVATLQNPSDRAYLAPLYFWCESCGNMAERPSRIFVDLNTEKPWRATHSEIADAFSLSIEYGESANCGVDTVLAHDTLILSSRTWITPLHRCPMRSTHLIIDEAAITTAGAQQALLALGWRSNLAAIVLPQSASAQLKTALLFDFFQRKNRRDMSSWTAFRESYARAEKSFSAESTFGRIQFYASLD